MFASPFEYCPICKDIVLLDQTHRECAGEHLCTDTSQCPLRRLFSGIEFREEEHQEKRPESQRANDSLTPAERG
jgi:hypothetical protein